MVPIRVPFHPFKAGCPQLKLAVPSCSRSPVAKGRLMDSSYVAIGRLAVFALGSLGPVGTDASEALRDHLQGQDSEVRQWAEIALARIASKR